MARHLFWGGRFRASTSVCSALACGAALAIVASATGGPTFTNATTAAGIRFKHTSGDRKSVV